MENPLSFYVQIPFVRYIVYVKYLESSFTCQPEKKLAVFRATLVVYIIVYIVYNLWSSMYIVISVYTCSLYLTLQKYLYMYTRYYQ